MSGIVFNTTTLTMTFDDEFNVFNASANGSVGWMSSLPFGGTTSHTLPGNSELEYYGNSSTGINPFSIQNGVLDITATVAPAGSNSLNLPYNSGAISSFDSAHQIYGVFAIRCELPAGAGLWPAFWLEPANNDGQAELDVFEILGETPSVDYQTTHGTNSNGTNAGIGTQYDGVNTSTGFHTYAVDWEPTTITYYVDGQVVNTLPTPASMDTPLEMIINLAVGGPGSWPGAPTSASEFPATMQVDWVRTYATANTIDVAGTQVITQGNGTASVTGQLVYSNNGAAATAVVGDDVTLVNTTNGNVIASVLTNSAGTYSFTGLSAGNYQIQYLPPPSEAVALNGPANFATDLTAAFTLATGQSYAAATQTLINTPSTIQGQVIYAATSIAMPLAGIVVTLLNATGGVLATATTNISGNYTFNNLYAGSYQVEYAAPTSGQAVAGGPTNTTTYVTPVVNLAVGQVLTMATESIVPVGASLAGQVQLSPGGSGGVGLGGVIVELLNSAGSIAQSTTTNSAGNYIFTGLSAGTYSTQIISPSGDVMELNSAANSATGLIAPVTLTTNQALTQPAEQLLSQPASIVASVLYKGPANWPQIGETVELLSSTGSLLATGVTGTAGTVTFGGLVAGSYELDYVSPSGTKISSGPSGINTATGVTSAFGVATGAKVTESYEYLIASPSSTFVGYVYFTNTAGVQTDLANVTVTLLDSAGNTLDSLLTTSAGGFQFFGLDAGTYQLRYSTPNGDTLQAGSAASAITGFTAPITLAAAQTMTVAPETFVAATSATATLAGSVTAAGTADVGVSVSLLSGGTTIASETTGPTGAFAFGGLAAGAYQVQYSHGGGQVYSAGPASSATGLTPSETVTAGQTLTLGAEALIAAPGTLSGAVTYAGAADAGATVTLLTQAGATVATTATASNGTFSFAALSPGAYEVQFSDTATQLYGSGPASSTTGLTGPVSIGAAQTVVLQTEALLPVPAAIGGSVTYAGAADAGVNVSLIGSAGTTVASTTTAADGTFKFSGLAPAVYELQYSAAAGQMFASGPANSTTGLTPAETLIAGETLTLGAEALILTPGTLTGAVTYAGAAYAAATVTLLTQAGATVATTTTAADGTFALASLSPGAYQVQYSHTATQLFGSGPANCTTGLTSPVSIGAAQTVALQTEALLPVPAAIGGTVTYMGAADPGVTVSLIGSAGTTLASTTTATDGTFAFGTLTPSVYEIQYSDAAGQMFGSGPGGSTGLTAAETLTAGETLTLPAENILLATVAVGGSVQISKSGSSPSAAAGEDVSLLNSAGTVVATTVSDNGGNFQFSGMTAGTYSVQYFSPIGATAEFGGAADPVSGQTAPITLAQGQSVALAPQQVLSTPASITASVLFKSTTTWAQIGETVELLSSTGSVLATGVTNTAGTVTFGGLAAGTYALDYLSPAGTTIVSGPSGINTTTGVTNPIAVAAGAKLTEMYEYVSATPASVVLGYVYAANAAGVSSALANVTVSLLDAAGDTLSSQLTSVWGGFDFYGVHSGTYQLRYSTPSGETLQAGSAVSPTTGLSGLLTVAAGQTLTVANETYVAATSAISGSVQTSSGSTPTALAGVAVSLVNAAGTLVASTVSGSTGSFQFNALSAGTYQVKYGAPSGQSLELGSLANSSTGLTSAISLGTGQSVTLLPEQMLSVSSSISGVVQHAGSGDPGTGQSGVTVSLLNAAGVTIGTTTTSGTGSYSFGNLAAGNYQLLYGAPTGEAIQAGFAANPTTGLSSVVTLGAGAALAMGAVELSSTSNIFSLTGSGATAVRGAGNYLVTGNASAGSLTLGAGNQSISLTGGNDTITTGAGNSTISALAGGNVITTGAGMNFITVDAKIGNVFDLNTGAAGTTSISGFNTAGDVLDLKTTLSGLSIVANLSNLASYVTATVSNGSTTLSVDPTPGAGTPVNFAILNGVTTSVAQLITNNAISFS
jgi:beta-glucanase (GH16 family)